MCTACGAVGGACCEGTNQCLSGATCATGAVDGGGNGCLACGGSGQRCCGGSLAGNGGTCNTGFGCINNTTGPDTCAACGAMGQPCCGSGTVATGTCNAGLACGNLGAQGIICVMP